MSNFNNFRSCLLKVISGLIIGINIALWTIFWILSLILPNLKFKVLMSDSLIKVLILTNSYIKAKTRKEIHDRKSNILKLSKQNETYNNNDDKGKSDLSNQNDEESKTLGQSDSNNAKSNEVFLKEWLLEIVNKTFDVIHQGEAQEVKLSYPDQDQSKHEKNLKPESTLEESQSNLGPKKSKSFIRAKVYIVN